MELGALVCTKQNPSCLVCPIQKFCKAFKKGAVEKYPVRNERKKTVKIQAAALVLKRGEKYLIRRRPLGRIMGGLWEFPEWKLAKNRDLSVESVRQRTLKRVGSDLKTLLLHAKFLGIISRNYTHHLEKLHVFLAEMPIRRVTAGGAPHGRAARRREHPWGCPPAGPAGSWPSAWMSKRDLQKYPFSSAHAKIAQLITGFAKTE
jgi:A/G-specific adenine glycosylase